VIDPNHPADLVESLHMNAIVRAQLAAHLAQGRGLLGFPLQFFDLLAVFFLFLIRFVLGRQGGRPRLFRFLAQLLQPHHFRSSPLLAPQILLGSTQQIARQLEPPGDLERIAHTKLANVQAIGRAQRFEIELHRRVLGMLVRERVCLEIAQVRGHHGLAAEVIELIQNGPPQGGPLGRIGTGPQFIEHHQRMLGGGA
jgi:hypothetical protein